MNVKKKSHLVVDGSNIATEGRQLPSLAQLEEALEAFLAEHRFERVTVVVDATFGHRITAKERKWYEEAVNAGRIITPPAGAIGRGDAFILEIAKRANAVVLSNDSFQEFHGDNPWLFDEGRLYGGKPVPHVGWVFVARSPVRGPTSRRAVKKAKSVERVDVTETTATRGVDALSSGEKARPADATSTSDATSARRRGRRSTATDGELVAASTSDEPASATSARGKRASGARDASTAQSADSRAIVDTRDTSTEPSSTTLPTATVATERDASSDAKRASSSTPKRFNDPEKYERFRDAHPVGSLIEIVVDRFSSHGAYARADDVEVYIPTKSLGDPPPQRARDVLHIGELVGLIVDRYDDETCAIDARAIRMDDDIAYYAAPRASTEMHDESQLDESPIDSSDDEASRDGSEQPTRRSEPVATKKKAAAKKAPAKKKAAAKKAPAKKAPAKKKAAAKKAPARKTAAKKAPAKRTAAKKTAAKKTTAKKAAAKKTTAKKTAAKKTAAKKAPAKRKAAAKKTAAKKAPAKRTAKRTATRR